MVPIAATAWGLPRRMALLGVGIILSLGPAFLPSPPLELPPNLEHLPESLPDEPLIVQLTDMHVGRSAESDAALTRMMIDIQALKPDLVVLTGDLVYHGSREEYERGLQLLGRLAAPVLVIPGNHERKGWGAYLQRFRMPYRRWDLGDLSVIGLDTGHRRDQLTRSQFRWLEGQLSDSRGRRLLVLTHHPLFGRRSLQALRDPLVRALSEAAVPLVLSGHWHVDACYDGGGQLLRPGETPHGTAFLVTTSAGGDLRKGPWGIEPYHGYRIVRLGRSSILTYTRDSNGSDRQHAVLTLPIDGRRS